MNRGAHAFKSVDISDTDNSTLSFLYNTVPGRALLKIIVRPPVSKLSGSILKSPASRVLIKGFIRRNSIDMEEYRSARFNSFNDFFIREIKEGSRPFPDKENDVAAPCDGKLTVYPVTPDSVFCIKRSKYSLCDLLQDRELADEFSDGVCLIFRLTPDDYHRYSCIDDGEVLQRKRIDGILHTVRPVAYQRYSVFCQNSREYTVMRTANFGKIIQVEVGALFAGRITNHNHSGAIKRGDEKGMFQFGGSTVIMLFQKDRVSIDETIIENTLQNKETIVRMGNKIGEKPIREERLP